MAEPRHINLSLRMGLLMVYVGYVVISNGIRILFSPSYVFDGDVLQAMPSAWISSHLVRLLMTLVLSVTAPLIVIPCGELVEGKLVTMLGGEDGKRRQTPTRTRVLVRVPFCLTCMVLSEFVPNGFVHLVSFIGCFCGGTTGLVLPPLFCLQLSKTERTAPRRSGADMAFLCDVMALCLGIAATSVTSYLTFRVLLERVAI